jgi:butyrate kinase
MPKAPVALYGKDITRAVDLLRRKDPEAVPAFVRQQLEANFNEAAQNLQSGPNQMGGPKFVANIAGNQQQRENLRTLIMESSGMQAYQGFEKFMDTMEAQGQRLPANSATAFNEMARQEMGAGFLSKAATPLQPSRVAKFFEEYQMGNNSKKLAEMLVDPDSVNKLEKLARTGPKSLKRQAIVNSLLSGYTAQKPEIKEEEPK